MGGFCCQQNQSNPCYPDWFDINQNESDLGRAVGVVEAMPAGRKKNALHNAILKRG